MSSPKLLRTKGRPFRILILGQAAVGKTALTVRFITRRFIGEYDPTLEKKYCLQKEINGDTLSYEILDTAGQDEDNLRLEENIRWADAFILVYAVTDRCSFDECTRLKFLINHSKSKRRFSYNGHSSTNDIPVALVGNMNDLEHDRMITFKEGKKRSEEMSCCSFYDISVRESYEAVEGIFEELGQFCKSYKSGRPDSGCYSPPSPRNHTTSFLEKIHKDVNLSPPSPRARGSTVIGLTVESAITRSGSDSCDGVKRKRSVSQRIMRKVLPSSIRHRTDSHGEMSNTSKSDSDSS